MKFSKLIAASLLAISAVPAAAQDAPPQAELSVGTVIMGNDGTQVGTIAQVMEGAVVLDTGNNQIPLPPTAFYDTGDGATINDTKANLDAKMDAYEAEQDAKLTAALTAGAELRSLDGVVVGTVQTVNQDGSIILALEDDEGSIQLPREQLATDDSGLLGRFTAAQLEAALGGG
ncbi:MAG TPA: hypothetical protein VLA37_01805 [Sphingomonadaceae bacterium]|nr:hypothetical protein [Sphingomonadaceae bacterium]